MELFRNTVNQNAGESAKTVMSGISETEIGSPPEYGGSPNSLNPEELLVASVNSCIMLVFFHFVNKFEVKVASYHSDAEGKVEKTKNGLRFTNIARLADKYCLVSGSLACPVHYEVEVVR
jgi:organic hydroperoxide reductase OsmC/OhrA